ncbi:MAG: SRPBCC family protein [Bacteroidetes bacterium]|nr:SRPBCC family protein [Bacteroidota bacterium]
MSRLNNNITINAPIEKIWQALSDIETLDQYDPTVKKSTALTPTKSGLGAKRKVEMLDGKNWFEEVVTVSKPNETLTYELTACSFPVKKLKHTYSFEADNGMTKVNQVMEYHVKFGLFGRLLDILTIRKQSDAGIKLFLTGLKSYAENS